MTREESARILEERVRVTEYVESSYVDSVDIEALRIAIKALAQPERKRGHWINAECKDGTIAHKCSECKCFVGYSVSSLTWFNFCPWCGADMRGNDGKTESD